MSAPLNALSVIAFTFLFFTVFVLFGDLIRVMLNKISQRKEEGEGLIEILNLNIALATSSVPLLTLLGTWTGRWLNTTTVCIIVLLMAIVRFYLMRKEGELSLGKVKSLLKEKLASPDHRLFAFIFSLVFFLTVFIRLYITVGLYVHPGDDAKMHSLYTLMIAESHGYPISWGQYGPEPYMKSPVCYMLGFHSVCAFLHLLTGISVEGSVLITTNIYNALSALSTYYLAKVIFKNKYVGLASAILIGLVSQQPLNFFGWGGNAELTASYLLITFLGLYYKAASDDALTDSLGFCFLLTTGIFYIHYLAIVYAICCIIPYSLYKLVSKKRFRWFLYPLLILGVALLFSLPMLLAPVMGILQPEKIETLENFAQWWWRDKQVLGFKGIVSWNCIYAFWNVFGGQFGLALTFFAFLGLILLLREVRRRTDEATYLIGWLAMLFAIFENGPYGLYFVKFPLWYNLLPDRFFISMAVPMSCLAAFGLHNLLKEQRITSVPRFKNMGKISGAAIIGLFLFIQMWHNVTYTYQLRSLSAVTSEDYVAFKWIRENIPEDATIYVTEADAGQWIPTIAHRRVFAQFTHQSEEFYNQEFLNDTGSLISLMHINPDGAEALALLGKYGVDYIFIGQKSIFNRARLDPNTLLGSDHYVLVYHQDGTEVYVFQVVY